MGRGRTKVKKFTLTNNDDTRSGEDERIPAQNRRSRHQKPSVDKITDIEKIEDEENTNVNDAKVMANGKKRKRNKRSNEEGDLVKEEIGVETKATTDGLTQVNGFRHTGSRRKSKPRRAAEAGVECK